MAIFGVWAQDDGIDTPTVLFVRFFAAALILAGVQYARGIPMPAFRRCLPVAAMGAIGYVGQSYCYFLGLEHADASLIALLLYLYPAFVAILAAVFLRERIGPVTASALVLALVGMALVVGGGNGEVIGYALGIGAAVIYSVYITVGAIATDGLDAIAVATVVCIAAAVVTGGIVLARFAAGEPAQLPESSRGWVSLGAIAAICTALAIIMFFAGMARLGATSTAVMSTLEPVVTVALATWLLNESLSAVQAVGAVVVIAAVVALALSHRPVAVQPSTPV
ncbi:MAG: DMT family transporter [Actinomycetota bacterium]|nr:DMT family transporter [Actinomycetota bacterium]